MEHGTHLLLSAMAYEFYVYIRPLINPTGEQAAPPLKVSSIVNRMGTPYAQG